ncbi:hypothetical protein S2091_4487 [Solimicrobium silvestre]|uniref:Uncharacterized protein n=1 Tax=Solimicrobium silvestre TaxID=2099400 RepID=A0A2S9GSX5_9BURK|nr:hypothetical protein S2091_4487 [Solimicrobium silvestre]
MKNNAIFSSHRMKRRGYQKGRFPKFCNYIKVSTGIYEARLDPALFFHPVALPKALRMISRIGSYAFQLESKELE